jgi:hypothetical protein
MRGKLTSSTTQRCRLIHTQSVMHLHTDFAQWLSDGSVRYNSPGSFGWVLAHLTELEWSHAWDPPARGPQRPASFRAEGYGLLSFLMFLWRVAEFTGMHDLWTGTIATNSQSLLQSLHRTDSTQPPPRFNAPIHIVGNLTILNPLQLDWDVLIEIEHKLSQLPEI